MRIPWLAGVVFLFAFEDVEGNTITRLYFMQLRRLMRSALDAGGLTPELERARGEPSGRSSDDPAAVLRWLHCGVAVATLLTLVVPRPYPWGSEALSP